MKIHEIRGRPVDCIDISELRPSDCYKVIVYHKGGDCRLKDPHGRDYCRDDCIGMHMAVEFYPPLTVTEKRALATLPPFRYIDPDAPHLLKGDPEKLGDLLQKGALGDVRRIRNEDTILYLASEIFGTERPGCDPKASGRILRIDKPRCGIEDFSRLMSSLPRAVFESDPFLHDALETYREIIANKSYFKSIATKMSDQELQREAALTVQTPWGRNLLLGKPNGVTLVKKAEEYRIRGINERVN